MFGESILSQDDLNLLEIPEPPTLISKVDNRSSCGSSSALTSDRKYSPNKSLSDLQMRQKPSIVAESEHIYEPMQTLSAEKKSPRKNVMIFLLI